MLSALVTFPEFQRNLLRIDILRIAASRYCGRGETPRPETICQWLEGPLRQFSDAESPLDHHFIDYAATNYGNFRIFSGADPHRLNRVEHLADVIAHLPHEIQRTLWAALRISELAIAKFTISERLLPTNNDPAPRFSILRPDHEELTKRASDLLFDENSLKAAGIDQNDLDPLVINLDQHGGGKEIEFWKHPLGVTNNSILFLSPDLLLDAAIRLTRQETYISPYQAKFRRESENNIVRRLRGIVSAMAMIPAFDIQEDSEEVVFSSVYRIDYDKMVHIMLISGEYVATSGTQHCISDISADTLKLHLETASKKILSSEVRQRGISIIITFSIHGHVQVPQISIRPEGWLYATIPIFDLEIIAEDCLTDPLRLWKFVADLQRLHERLAAPLLGPIVAAYAFWKEAGYTFDLYDLPANARPLMLLSRDAALSFRESFRERYKKSSVCVPWTRRTALACQYRPDRLARNDRRTFVMLPNGEREVCGFIKVFSVRWWVRMTFELSETEQVAEVLWSAIMDWIARGAELVARRYKALRTQNISINLKIIDEQDWLSQRRFNESISINWKERASFDGIGVTIYIDRALRILFEKQDNCAERAILSTMLKYSLQLTGISCKEAEDEAYSVIEHFLPLGDRRRVPFHEVSGALRWAVLVYRL